MREGKFYEHDLPLAHASYIQIFECARAAPGGPESSRLRVHGVSAINYDVLTRALVLHNNNESTEVQTLGVIHIQL